MKVYNKKLFRKYKNNPVRIASMGTKYLAIVENSRLIASFDKMKTLRKFFPFGKYVKLE